MRIYLEANERKGEGYRLRAVIGPTDGAAGEERDRVLDDRPYTLYEAIAAAGKILDRVNTALGNEYRLYEVLIATTDAIERNAGRDIASARICRDIQDGTRRVVDIPAQPTSDLLPFDSVDLFAGVEGIELIYSLWMMGQDEDAENAMRRYCEYIAMHGFHGGASGGMAWLKSAEEDTALDWIEDTFDRYVKDPEAMASYVL